MPKPDIDRVMQVAAADERIGFCMACGAEIDDIDPDARNNPCDLCGEEKVFGAVEILIMEV